MGTVVEFLSPVHIYTRKAGSEWEAWADPFSVVGEGATREEAIENAKRNVEDYLSALAEAIHRHGNKVDLLTPLKRKDRRGTCKKFLVYASRHVKAARRARKKVRDLNRKNLLSAIRKDADLGLVPVPVG